MRTSFYPFLFSTLLLSSSTSGVLYGRPVSCDALGLSPDFSISIDQLTVSFTDLSTSNGSIDSVKWEFGDGTAVTVPHRSLARHIYGGPGTFDVCQTLYSSASSGTICTEEVCEQIVLGKVTNCAGLNLDPDFSSSTDDLSVNLVNTSRGDSIDQFIWNFGDGTEANDIPGVPATHKYAQDGEYDVCLEVKALINNTLECADTYCERIKVEKSATQTTTGVPEDLASQGWAIFPNPVRNELVIRFGDVNLKETQLHIYSVAGSLEKQMPILMREEVQVSMTGLTPGMYIVAFPDYPEMGAYRMIKQ